MTEREMIFAQALRRITASSGCALALHEAEAGLALAAATGTAKTAEQAECEASQSGP